MASGFVKLDWCAVSTARERRRAMMGMPRREGMVQGRLLYVSNLLKMGSSGLISVASNLGLASVELWTIIAGTWGGLVVRF